MLKNNTLKHRLVCLVIFVIFTGCAQKMDVIYNHDTTKPLILTQGSKKDTIVVNSPKWEKFMLFAEKNRTGWEKREKGFISSWVLTHVAFNLGLIEDGNLIGIHFKDENGNILIYQKEIEKGSLDFLIE